MAAEHNINVANLPTLAFGSRAPLWWGMILMMAIEGSIFAILVASYLYLRIGFTEWPPPLIPTPHMLVPTVNLVILLASTIPIYISGQAVKRGDRHRAMQGLALNIVLAITFLVLRFVEFHQLGFGWDGGVYGSLVWVLMGLHTMHVIADTLQTTVLLGLFFDHKDGEKQQLGVEVDGLYWYFVVLSWIPLYFLLFLYPYLLRS